jgi:hypothetical protein
MIDMEGDMQLPERPQTDRYGVEIYATPWYWASEFLKYTAIVGIILALLLL